MEKRFFAIMMGMLMVSICLASAQTTKEIDYSAPTKIQTTADPNFFVKVLKYDPFPVNAGDWFDLWIKVQNIGQNDAPDSIFELSPSYPFESNDSLVRSYGLIPGTINSFKVSSEGDASQVILKYRVKAADNSPEGSSNIKFIAKTNGDSSSAVSFDLPIEVAKTKTQFDVKLRDINPRESSFIITNIGDNDAKAVTVDAKMDEAVALSGAEPVMVGNLNQGDFTIAHLQIVPQSTAKTITLEISYTDTVGIRSTTEKTISLTQNALQNICVQPPSKGYVELAWAAGGLITGVFLVILLKLFRQKAKQAK